MFIVQSFPRTIVKGGGGGGGGGERVNYELVRVPICLDKYFHVRISIEGKHSSSNSIGVCAD